MIKRLTLTAALLGLSATAFAAPVSYKIDPAHTDVIASWNHLGFSTPSAHFGDVDGTINYDAKNVKASSVKVTLPLSGMDVYSVKFDQHIRSDQLLDTAKFPTIAFESTKVEAVGKGKLRVSGNVTVKGVTKPAVLDVTLNGQGVHPMAKKEAIGFNATTTLKRSDFGLDYAVPMVSDEVTIRITTEALAQ